MFICMQFSNLYDTDMDVVFAIAHIEGVSPVSVSLRKEVPRAGTTEANRILGHGA